jgi:hypothetical protein
VNAFETENVAAWEFLFFYDWLVTDGAEFSVVWLWDGSIWIEFGSEADERVWKEKSVATSGLFG